MVGDLTTKDCVTLAAVVKNMTLEEALVLLNSINRSYQYKTILQVGEIDSRMFFRDLARKATNCYRLLSYLPDIWFRGGPTGQKWFKGTPLTFVMDCLLDATIMYGEEVVADHIYNYYTAGAP